MHLSISLGCIPEKLLLIFIRGILEYMWLLRVRGQLYVHNKKMEKKPLEHYEAVRRKEHDFHA